MTYEQVKELEIERLKEMLLTQDQVAVSQFSFDLLSMRSIINKLKRQGWQIAAIKHYDNSLIGYQLKNKSKKSSRTKKAKTPSLAGNRV